MITKTDAIVIKSMKFRDTSKIVTFYTRQYGKLKAVAKGARDSKSKFGAGLEPMTHVSLVLYKKEHRDLQLVTESYILTRFKKTHSEMERMSVGMAILELIDKVVNQEEQNLPLYSTMLDAFRSLEESGASCPMLFHAFELKVVSAFGFSPSLAECAQCGRRIGELDHGEQVEFLIGKGRFLCSKCSGSFRQTGSGGRSSGYHRISAASLKILHEFLSAPLSNVSSREYDRSVRNEIDETLRLYVRHHFEDLRPLKSIQIFQKLLA